MHDAGSGRTCTTAAAAAAAVAAAAVVAGGGGAVPSARYRQFAEGRQFGARAALRRRRSVPLVVACPARRRPYMADNLGGRAMSRRRRRRRRQPARRTGPESVFPADFYRSRASRCRPASSRASRGPGSRL